MSSRIFYRLSQTDFLKPETSPFILLPVQSNSPQIGNSSFRRDRQIRQNLYGKDCWDKSRCLSFIVRNITRGDKLTVKIGDETYTKKFSKNAACDVVYFTSKQNPTAYKNKKMTYTITNKYKQEIYKDYTYLDYVYD